MARLTCRRCGCELPSAAAACPKCGTVPRPASAKPVPSEAELTELLPPSGKPGGHRPAPDTSTSAGIPAKIGPYQVLEEIGRGGMGVILQGSDEKLKRLVAIKVLLPEVQNDPQHRYRFVEEARLTGQLEHPGVVPVHLLGEDDQGREYFSMKLVSGRSLHDVLADWHAGEGSVRKEFPLHRLVSVFERIAETVGFAHSHGVLHRDLKPSNVMIGDHGEVWVLDWGLAKVLGEVRPGSGARIAASPARAPAQSAPAASGSSPASAKPPSSAQAASVRNDLDYDLTMDGTTMGTPNYMAPEQARGEELDEGADIFGLGAILYEMLTGSPPTSGRSVDEILSRASTGRFTPIRRTRAGRRVPRALSAIAEKCLARDRADRYASVEDLVADLRAWMAGGEVLACPDTLFDRAWRFARRHRTPLTAGAAVAALILATVTVASMQVAAKGRRALEAERLAKAESERAALAESERERERAKALEAELGKQRAQAELAARAQRRLKAFAPYAQAADLINRGQLPEQAVELLKQALAVDAEFPEAQFALGEALRMSGRPSQAAEAYLLADELSRRIGGRAHLQALLAAGFAYDNGGEYALAAVAFERAEKDGADDPLALVGRAFRLAYRRKMNDARAAADEAYRRGPHLWEAHFCRGFMLEDSIELGLLARQPAQGEAIAAFRRTLELSPRQAQVCFWFARCLLRLGTPEARQEAIALIDRGVALEPKNGNNYLMRSHFRQGMGDQAGAAADVAEAERVGASAITLLFTKAMAASRQGRQEESFQLIGEAVKKSGEFPSFVANWLNLGLALGKRKELQPVYERWRRDNPDYPDTYIVGAQLRNLDGDFPGAELEARTGLKLASYHPKLWAWLSHSLARQGKWEEALTSAERCVELEPGAFEGRLLRLQALVGLKRTAEALSELAAVEKDFPASARSLTELRRRLEAANPAGK